MTIISAPKITFDLPYLAGIQQVLSHPTWDLILVFAMIAAAFFYGLSRGKHKLLSNIVHTYVALAVFALLPVDTLIKASGSEWGFWGRVVLFLVVFSVISFLLNSRRGKGLGHSGPFWQIILLSLLQVGLLTSIIFSFLPAEITKNLAPLTKRFIANPDYKFWWSVLPISFVLFVRILDRRMD